MPHWSSKTREIDCVVRADRLIGCKRWQTSALEFGWFAKMFPRSELWIVGQDDFAGARTRGRTFTESLRDESW